MISSLNHGGAEKQTIFDANYFSRNNNVTLVTFKDGELKDLVNREVDLQIINKEGYLKTSRKISKIIEEKKIEVISSSLFASMIISVMSAKNNNIPVVWNFHSHEFEAPFKSKLAFKYFSRKKCVKKIFFVSNELKEYFMNEGYNFPFQKQDVLYNTFTVNIDTISEKIDKHIVIIGFVGRLVGLKRVNYLIETAKYFSEKGINNIEFHIIGDGELKKELMEYAKLLNVEDKIKFMGYINNVEKNYNDFDIFALPSEEECLSMSLIDACVKSIPCVAFDIGGNNEIIKNNETGFLVKSKGDFMEKILNLVVDNNIRKKIGDNASKYCYNKFNSENRYEYLENVLKNIN